jgi:hypothetical protein
MMLWGHHERLHGANAVTAQITAVNAEGMDLKVRNNTMKVKLSSNSGHRWTDCDYFSLSHAEALLALGIKRVVHNGLAFEEFVIEKTECREAMRNPASHPPS